MAGVSRRGRDAMKIRDRRLIAAAGWCGTRLVRLLSATLRFDSRSVGSVPADPLAAEPAERFIYALWHENFLIPIVRFGTPAVAALVSRHADGQVLGSLIRATGMRVVHGSTSRGGVAAVRQLLRADAEHRHLAVTPDGPRGPRRVVQPGVVYLASRAGMRIVPVGVGHRRPWRMKSWDSFAVPRPFSRVRCLFGEPLAVPPGLAPYALEPHAGRLQVELDRLTAAAQSWADTGRLELPPAILRTRVVQHPPRTVEVAGVVREAGG
jgi:lysophospholipid acyltransferase (LPLAT)-like uncharacterized protein